MLVLITKRSFAAAAAGRCPLFERVKESFDRQGLMKAMGATLSSVSEGAVEIRLPHSDKVTQQQGGFHGGAVGAIADVAAGFACLTMAPPGDEVATIEYKINFVRAFNDGELVAKGRVLKAGRRLLVAAADVYHEHPVTKAHSLCAVLQQTIIPVHKTY